MLNNDQLMHLSRAMHFDLEGVYFKDELPRKLKYNTGYIINLQNSEDEEGKPNDGSHWTALQVNKYPNGLIEPLYFDPYGAPPSESVKKFVKTNCNKALPYTTVDIQSLMNNACGYYCAAFLFYVNCFPYRTKHLYTDGDAFVGLFNDLEKTSDFKYNEFVLKHFFQSKDKSKQKAIDVLVDTDEISSDDCVKIPVNAVNLP